MALNGFKIDNAKISNKIEICKLFCEKKVLI